MSYIKMPYTCSLCLMKFFFSSLLERICSYLNPELKIFSPLLESVDTKITVLPVTIPSIKKKIAIEI